MAYLTAWIPFVYLDKLFALPSQLIFQHVCEHIPAIAGYGLTKTEFTAFLAFSHRLDADILDTNSIIFVYQIASILMQKVATLIGNFLMKHSYAKPLLLTIVASFLPFG